jgi:integrase
MSARRSLTATQVAAIKDDGVHWVAPSLYMQVRAGQGTRSWLFRYSRNDTNQWMGLGSVEDKTFTEARDEAAMLRVLVKRGEDPIASKREVEAKRQIEEKAKAPSFDECAKQYIASHESSWKNDKHIAQWKSTLRDYAGPVVGKTRVDEISVEDVLKVLNPIWIKKPETASRLRGRIEKVLGWATAMKYRSGENPAAWTGALQHLLPATSSIQTVEHHKAVPYKDVPKVMADLRKADGIGAKALMFTVLTVSRTGETLGAKPEEFDFEAKVWTVPAERMKAGREHRVPLTNQAIAIVTSLIEPDQKYVFHNEHGRQLSNMTMMKALRTVRDDSPTVHGFRSSFRDWAAEQTDAPREVVEACLAHAVGDAAELAYKRSDFLEKRRALMKDWLQHCAEARRREG